jgi:hypothetical protein
LTKPVADDLASRGFNAGLGFFHLAMAVLCAVFVVCSGSRPGSPIGASRTRWSSTGASR